ncbi:MAG: GTPase domain-containing protein [Chitinispirillaceae bacterium]|nr:GTPase domain-containing protein [Chitinispirillaceae bacterium]
MDKKGFTAKLSRGRNGWCAIFFHPLKTKGGKSVRVRRGLGTDDEQKAENYIEQINQLLSDKNMWTQSARKIAEEKFDSIVIRAFFENVTGLVIPPIKIRDGILPLPTIEDGYSKVLLLGTTGAGKTTLLRQFIGTDPIKERFPSVSTAKTTTFDTEVILSEGQFECAVSFLSREQTRMYVEECVIASTLSAIEGQNDLQIARNLLEHKEQRFRLSYVLGSYPLPKDLKEDEDNYDEDELHEYEPETINEDSSIPDKRLLNDKLHEIISVIKNIAEEIEASVTQGLGDKYDSLQPVDKIAYLDLSEENAQNSDKTQTLVDDILNIIENKFTLIDQGQLERDTSDEWPVSWNFICDDRALFLKTINRFSSNYASYFGALLAPVVSGMRVKGPFIPNWNKAEPFPKIVFLDGEGLGHTPSTATNVSSSIIDKFDYSDTIVIVDNAQQPAQAATASALRSLTTSGHARKVVVALTHFDQVSGPNLPTVHDKREHVFGSIRNTLQAIDSQTISNTGTQLLKMLENGRTFFLGRLNENLGERSKGTIDQLKAMIKFFMASIEKVPLSDAIPVYDMANFVLCIHSAYSSFHQQWNSRLNLSVLDSIKPEHWSRVKALSKRYAEQTADEYDNLKPIADLLQSMLDRLVSFINNPRRWKPENASQEQKELVAQQISERTTRKLLALIRERMAMQNTGNWKDAYQLSGRGSTINRARKVRTIYESVAPVPQAIPEKEASDFLDVLRSLFREAAKEFRAEFIS